VTSSASVGGDERLRLFLGFRLPEPRQPVQAYPVHELGGLHARLVKRAPPDEGLRAGNGAEVRSSVQTLA